MQIKLHVLHESVERTLCWISLQPDGSISVGLADRAFISQRFQERNFVWNLYNRLAVKYEVASSPKALNPITNPHLTFHPPIHFHLTDSESEQPFKAIAEPELMLLDSENVPWVRFVSKPVSELAAFNGTARNQVDTIIEKVIVPSSEHSIGVSIDFVQLDCEEKLNPNFLFERYIVWQNHKIHIFCEIMPAQIATLGWFYEG